VLEDAAEQFDETGHIHVIEPIDSGRWIPHR